MAEFMICPRCGERVDENPNTGKPDDVPVHTLSLVGGQQADFVFCAHCGAVLGVIARTSTTARGINVPPREDLV